MSLPAASLSFDRPVARNLVHRESTSEVLPTDFAVRSADRFEVALQWPRRHAFFRSAPADSAIVAESIRQVTILICHLGYDVPLGTRFLMTGLGFDVRPDNDAALLPGHALELSARVRGIDVRRTARGALRSVRLDMEFVGAGGVVASGHGDALLADEPTYARMRGTNAHASPPLAQTLPRVAPDAVGRSALEDVVVARTAEGLTIDVDGNHPFFFDHLLDHVPGVALIEACRQAACLLMADPAVDLAAFEAEFNRMVEFGPSATIAVDVVDSGARFQVVQSGSLALDASAVITSSSAEAAEQ
jgi:2-oxo-3-(phosphooxy)propyl 3-oxoalkanoate synthase